MSPRPSPLTPQEAHDPRQVETPASIHQPLTLADIARAVADEFRRDPANAVRGAEGPRGRVIPAHPDASLYPDEVAWLLGVSLRTLEKARLTGGDWPAFIKIGRSVRYRRGDVESWLRAHRRVSTSDTGEVK